MSLYAFSKKSIFIFTSFTLFIGGNFSLAFASNKNLEELLTTTFDHSSGSINYILQDETLKELAGSCVDGDADKCATLESKKSELLVLMDEQYSVGVEAWKKKDYSEALKLFLALSEKGHPNAQRMVGMVYQYGLETDPNAEEALKWFKLSAGQNFSPSQYKVGEVYYYSFSNDSEAAKWYQLSANQGYRRAKVQLGFMYFNGEGVDQNYQKARDLVEPSLEENDKFAQYIMGKLYYDGHSVEQDSYRAIELYEMSANQGFAPAQSALGKHELKNRQYGKAIDWFMPAAQDGFTDAEIGAGFILINHGVFQEGKGMRKLPKTGSLWLERAASKNSAEAAYYLGGLYRYGNSYNVDDDQVVHVDMDKALKWYVFAAEKGEGNDEAAGNAARELASMYEKGDGVPQDSALTKKWYLVAAEKGNPDGLGFVAKQEANKQGKMDELLTVEIAGRNRSLEDPSLKQLAAKCVEGDQNACSDLENQKPDAIAELTEELKNMVDCKVKRLIGTTYGDFYQSYVNDDWSRKKDREYNFLINLEWTVTYKGSENSGAQGKYGEDFIGVMNKDAIVPFKKMGNKFIPVFSNHMSVIDIVDHPEITQAFLLAEVGSAEHLLFGKSKCTIEKISKK